MQPLLVCYQEKGDGKDQIWVMDADGAHARNISGDTLHNFYPSWFGNRKIVYAQVRKGLPSRATVCKVAGNKKKPLLDIHSHLTRPSPDARMIAYVDQKAQCIKLVDRRGRWIADVVLPER